MLSDLGILLLDVLGEVGGGRGEFRNHLTRFILGITIWSITFVWAWSLRKRHPHPRESLILIGLAMGLFRELCMFAGASLVVMDSVPLRSMTHFFPPLEVATKVLSEVAIAAAFLLYLFNDPVRTKRFILMCVCCVVPLYLISIWPWWIHIAHGGSELFASHWTGMLLYSVGTLVTGYVVIQFARSSKPLHWLLCIPFALFFLDHLLALLNAVVGDSYTQVLAPVRNTIHLIALPWFSFIYWREQAAEQRRLSEIVNQSSRLDTIGRLAAGVAHDFNNHLHAILGYAELGKQQGGPKSQSTENFDKVIDSVERASALVGQLMAFQRENDGENDKAVDVSRLLSDLAPMTRSLVGSSIRIDQALDERPAMIRADRITVEQMIVNLAANARDAMPDGGTLTVRSRIIDGSYQLLPGAPSKPYMRFSISDTGVGMDANVLRHASEPFFTTKAKSGGTGLGLASVFNLVNRLDGAIDIDSKPGHGTTVTIDLPLADVDIETSEAQEPAKPARRGQGQLILFAEDDVANRHIAAAHLRGMGYEVVTAVDGGDAVNVALGCDRPIDLLLLDIAMPEFNGYTARERIVEKLGDIPAVFITARTSGATAPANGFVHLSKPFRRHELARVVAEALSSKPDESPASA